METIITLVEQPQVQRNHDHEAKFLATLKDYEAIAKKAKIALKGLQMKGLSDEEIFYLADDEGLKAQYYKLIPNI